MSPLVATLWITLIGMGLVFIAILLLWGLMEALMRFAARFAVQDAEIGETGPLEDEPAAELPGTETPSEYKRRAVAAAAAVAFALQKHGVSRLSPPEAAGSAWQSVTRANQLNHPTHITRKSRGRMR